MCIVCKLELLEKCWLVQHVIAASKFLPVFSFMASRLLQRQLIQAYPRLSVQNIPYRRISVYPSRKDEKKPERIEIPVPQRPPRQESWLTTQLRANPRLKHWFVKTLNLLGYGGPKQLAGRRTMVIFERICAGAPDINADFWHHGAFRHELHVNNPLNL